MSLGLALLASTAGLIFGVEGNQTQDHEHMLANSTGTIQTTSRLFGDVGFSYASRTVPGTAKASFQVGSLDFEDGCRSGRDMSAGDPRSGVTRFLIWKGGLARASA
jgi:hypothetical protein